LNALRFACDDFFRHVCSFQKVVAYCDENSGFVHSDARQRSRTGVAVFFGNSCIMEVSHFTMEAKYGQGILKRQLTQRCQQALDEALKAVDQAPDGQWIAASEWEVRDIFRSSRPTVLVR